MASSDLVETAPGSAPENTGGSGVYWAAEFRIAVMVAHRELLRFFRAPGRLLSSFVMPLTFLVIFGFGLNRLIGASGGVDFVQFVLPGVVAMIVTMSGLTNCIMVVWDREFGFLREMLVAPPHRISLITGRIAGGALIGSVQGAVLLLLTPLLGINLSPGVVVATIAVVILMAVAGTSVGMFLASWIRRMESFSAVMPLVTMPMMFLSGALFPVTSLPGWLAVPIHLNPLTYAVDALRRVVLADHAHGGASQFTAGVELFGHTVPIVVELGLVAALALVFAVLAARRFGRPD